MKNSRVIHLIDRVSDLVDRHAAAFDRARWLPDPVKAEYHHRRVEHLLAIDALYNELDSQKAVA